MLIAQVISSIAGGGAEKLVREMAARLPDHGFNSNAIYFKKSPLDAIVSNEIVLGLSTRSPLAIFKLRKVFKKFCRNNDEVIIHAHLTWPFFYVPVAALFLRVKIVYTEHSTVNKRRKIGFLSTIDKFFYNKYSKIICISAGVKKSLLSWVSFPEPQKVIIVPNGVSLYTLYHRDPLVHRLPNLVSVGSLTYKKGHYVAIQAISLIRDQIAGYTIVGEGPERKKLEGLIADLKLTDKVKLVGWSNDVKADFLGADLLLIPSLWEGFGLVAVEGMSTGLPVVASNVDGLREVLCVDNPAASLVGEYRNSQAWADSILDMVEKIKTDADRLSEAARQQAKKFTLDAMVAGYAEVYRNL